MRDHWQDVLVGSIVGTVFAFFSYRQYYPSLGSEYSHRPYSPRIPREDEERLEMHDDPFEGGGGDPQPYDHHHHHDNVDDEEYELEGTVLRPHPPESLEDMWKSDEHAPPVRERSVRFGKQDDGLVLRGSDGTSALRMTRPEDSREIRLPDHVYRGAEDLR